MAGKSMVYPVHDVAAVCGYIQAHGGPAINPAAQAGTVETHGCTLEYSITPRSILVSVASKPFYVSYDMIWSQLGTLFQDAGLAG